MLPQSALKLVWPHEAEPNLAAFARAQMCRSAGQVRPVQPGDGWGSAAVTLDVPFDALDSVGDGNRCRVLRLRGVSVSPIHQQVSFWLP